MVYLICTPYALPNKVHVDYFDGLFQLNYVIPLYKFTLSFLADKDKKMQYKFFDSAETLEIKEVEDKQLFEIEKKHVQPFKPKLNLPPWYPGAPYLQIGYKKDWKSLSALNASFYGKVEIYDPALLQFVEDVKNKSWTDEKAVLHCLRYSQANCVPQLVV